MCLLNTFTFAITVNPYVKLQSVYVNLCFKFYSILSCGLWYATTIFGVFFCVFQGGPLAWLDRSLVEYVNKLSNVYLVQKQSNIFNTQSPCVMNDNWMANDIQYNPLPFTEARDSSLDWTGQVSWKSSIRMIYISRRWPTMSYITNLLGFPS